MRTLKFQGYTMHLKPFNNPYHCANKKLILPNAMKYLALLFLVGFLMIGCTDDDPKKDNDKNGDDGKRYPVAVLNIKGAQSVAVLENSNGGRMTAEESNFYKIKADNSMEKVTFVNADGTAIDPAIAAPVVIVSNMVDLDDKFLLLSGTFQAWDTLGVQQSYSDLLVRKTDGAIFNFLENNVAFSKVKLGDNLIKHDAAGNIYYPNFTGVTKLSVSDPEKITKEEYLSSGQTAQFFEITPEGGAVYKYGEGGGVTAANGTDQIRIKKPGGGIFEVKVDGRDNRQFWTGINGATYLITYTWANGYQPAIHKITLSGDNVNVEQVWSNDTFDYPGVGNMLRTSTQGSYRINKEKSVVFIDTYYSKYGNDYSWEFNEETNTVTNIENLPAIEEKAIIVSSSDHYYIATGTEIYKVDLNTHEYTTLIGGFDVYSMNVTADNKLQFSGLRMDDGKKVFAEITSEGTFVLIDQEIGKSATVLQRLN